MGRFVVVPTVATYLLAAAFASCGKCYAFVQISKLPHVVRSRSHNKPERTGLFANALNVEKSSSFAATTGTNDITANRQPLFIEPPMITAMRANMTKTDMMIMTAAGSALTVGVIYTLATSGDTMGATSSESGVPEQIAALEEVVGNVVDVALPLSATDVVSIAIGESLAGLFSAAVGFFLALRVRAQSKNSRPQGTPSVSDAIADGDFILAQAAAEPLLEAFGAPRFVAIVGAVIFAAVPAEITKIGVRRRDRLREEDRLMEELLVQQKLEQAQSGFRPLELLKLSKQVEMVDPETLKPARKAQGEGEVDVVEIFCDIMKWLEYNLLNTKFAGLLALSGQVLPPGAEQAIFGSLASLSTQVYGDFLYANFGFGSEDKRQAFRTRTLSDWTFIYLTRSMYGFILFGVYEATRVPTSFLVDNLFAGGIPVQSCVGFQQFNLCAGI